jgi:hypothetical protein
MEVRPYQKLVPDINLRIEDLLFCEKCTQLAHGKATKRDGHKVQDIAVDCGCVTELDFLSVIYTIVIILMHRYVQHSQGGGLHRCSE